MKRTLAFLTFLVSLFAVSACHYNVNLSVAAHADLTYANGDILHTDIVEYEGYHRNSFSNDDLEHIFIDLTQHASPDFTTAILYLSVFDEIKGAPLRDETYGVVYNSHSGHYDFADMDIRY